MLLARSGVEVPQERLESLAKTLQEYRSRLKTLYAVDVEGEESAAVFRSGEGWNEEATS